MVKGFAVTAIAASFALLGTASCDYNEDQTGDVSLLHSTTLFQSSKCIDLKPPIKLMEQPLLTIDIGMLNWSDGIGVLEESGMPLLKGN